VRTREKVVVNRIAEEVSWKAAADGITQNYIIFTCIKNKIFITGNPQAPEFLLRGATKTFG
jgi:hypothetical protein